MARSFATSRIASSSRVVIGTRSLATSRVSVVDPLVGDVFVAKTGNDSNAGTEISPKLTIGGGLAILSGGQTLIVKAGTYVETIGNTVPNGTNLTGDETLIAANPGDTVIVRSAATSRCIDFTTTKAFIEFRGMDFDGVNSNDLSTIKWTDGAHHIRMRDCEVYGSPLAMGILATEGSGTVNTFHEVINCFVHDNGNAGTPEQPAPPHGIYFSTTGNLIKNNIISNNPNGFGIHLFGGTPDDNIVRDNLIKNNLDGMIIDGDRNSVFNNLFMGHGIDIVVGTGATSIADNEVYNNSFYHTSSGGWCIGIRNLVSTTQVKNNIAWATVDMTDDQIRVESGAANNTLTHNITREAIFNAGTNTTLSNNTTGDPLYVDPVNENLHLQAGSGGVDTGTNLSAEGFSVDKDGAARPQGSAWDRGAYER